MLLIEDRILKLPLRCGPFTMSSWVGLSNGFIGLASEPAGANRDDPCNGKFMLSVLNFINE